MKSLYDDDFRYTKDGQDIDREIHSRMAAEFDNWVRKGYSPREISHIMLGAIWDMELTAVLTQGCEKYRKKVNAFLEKQTTKKKKKS